MHVVIVDNTETAADESNARFLSMLLTFLHELRDRGDTVTRVTCVHTLEAFLDLSHAADRVILSGSSAHVHELQPDDPRVKLATHVVAEAMRKGRRSDRTPTPVLGICFGAQVLNAVFGGSLRSLSSLMCRKRSVVWVGAGKGRTQSFHFCLKYLPDKVGRDLVHVGRLSHGKDAGTTVAFSHRGIPVHGVLFHPEATPDTGHSLIRRFLLHGALGEVRDISLTRSTWDGSRDRRPGSAGRTTS